MPTFRKEETENLCRRVEVNKFMPKFEEITKSVSEVFNKANGYQVLFDGGGSLDIPSDRVQNVDTLEGAAGKDMKLSGLRYGNGDFTPTAATVDDMVVVNLTYYK